MTNARDVLAREREALDSFCGNPDCQFVVDAPPLVSELVDELTQRRAEVARLQGQLARIQACR